MSAPSVASFRPSPGWSPQRPGTRSLCSGAWLPSIELVSGAGPVARRLDEQLALVAHADEEVSAGSLGSLDDDTAEEWADDAPLALKTVASTVIMVGTARSMTFSPVGDEFDPGLD